MQARDDVQSQFLQPSTKTTRCPFKGTATDRDIRTKDAKVEEHAGSKGRLAFDVAASAALVIRSLP